MAGLSILLPGNRNRSGTNFCCLWIRCFRAMERGATKNLNGGVAALDEGHGDPATASIISIMYDFWLHFSTSPLLTHLRCSTLTAFTE